MMADLKNDRSESICWKDCGTMMNALDRYGITDTGPIDNKNLYILNDNATAAKMRKVMANIRNRLTNEPTKKFLIIYVFAGHGMNTCGK